MPRGRRGRYRTKRRQHMAASKIQAFFRRKRGGARYLRAGTSVRTGFLNVQQKVIDTSYEIPSGPAPNGIIKKYEFKAADIAQWNTMASLFDQYRINGIKMTWLPTTNTNDQNNPGGTFATSIDLDGDNNITTFDQLLQCANTHTSAWSTAGGMTPYKKVFLRPRCHDALITDLDAQGQPSTFSAGLANRKQWLDISDRGLTTHYGLNIGWYFGNNALLSNPQELNVIITYYLQFRKVR